MASGADRISALPDELLHHVMSFLPMHEVVYVAARPVLAWPLEICPCPVRHWCQGLWQSQMVYLVRWQSAPITTPWYPPGLIQSQWVWLQFQAILAHLWCGCEYGVPDRFAVPSSCNLIAHQPWHLCWKLGPASGATKCAYHLPAPQNIGSSKVTLKRSTLDFSGCPTLVNLKMKECDINGNVPSPFLKHLSITSCYFVTRSFRARIYMPGLISLVLSECTHRTPLLENMPLLVLVIVRVKDCENKCSKSTYGDCGDHTCLWCYDFDHGANDRRGECLLLKGLSQVTELELSVDSTVFIVNRDLKLCPTFCKLKTLFLSAWCPGVAADRNVLTCFLQHSPIMEKLVLQLPKVPKDRVGTESSYKRSEHSFICSHLKIVDLKCEEVDGRVQETLEILSTYGIPLEHVNIQQTDMVSGPWCTLNLPVRGPAGLLSDLLSP